MNKYIINHSMHRVMHLLFALLCMPLISLQAQCDEDFELGDFIIINADKEIDISEISGLTAVEETLYFITDDVGIIASIDNDGEESYSINENNLGCSDLESITFIESIGNVNRFAISEERSRSIYIIDINIITDETAIRGHITLSGITETSQNVCGGAFNNGIEGLAYNSQTRTMYFGEEGERIIRSFELPQNLLVDEEIVSNNINQVIDLQNIPNFTSCSFSGMDVLTTGNLLLLMTHGACTGDSGEYPRKLVEVSSCGDFISELILEDVLTGNIPNTDPPIPRTNELEGVVVVDGHLYLIGENKILYDLVRDVESSLTIISPASGNIFAQGDGYTIEWQSENLFGDVTIGLYKNGILSEVISSSFPVSAGSLQTNFSADILQGDDYEIIITSGSGSNQMTASSGEFSIISASSITVTSPSAGNAFSIGSGATVEWDSENIMGPVVIDLLQSNSLVTTLSTGTADDGQQNVTFTDPAITSSGDYQIRICSSDNPPVCGIGSTFTIQDAPEITVISPGLNDVFAPGQMIDITWTSVNLTGNVRVYLYQGNSFVATVTSSTQNDGIVEDFTLPTTLLDGTNYVIRIISAIDGTVYDDGDNFSINSDPVITVLNPIAGDDFLHGETMTINWSSINLDPNEPITITLFDNQSAFTYTIVTGTSNTGTYSFVIPPSVGTGSNYFVKVESSNVFDESGLFEIQEVASLIITSPNAGEIINPTVPYSVQWTSNIGPDEIITINLIQNGNVIATLASVLNDDGQHSVTFPPNIPDGNYQIELVSVNPSLQDISGVFTIDASGCPDVVNITTTAVANSNVEASSKIQSNIPITNNNTAVYHAGTEVLLNNGFVAGGGTIFRAHIEQCSGTFQAFKSNSQSEDND